MPLGRVMVVRVAFVVACLAASVQGKGTTVEDPHNREVHGASMRQLHARMASAGDGQLTDGDVGILFLRYQREFNRSYGGGSELSQALAAFSANARRVAKQIHSGSGSGIEYALNEMSDVAAEDWSSRFASKARRIKVPFAPPNFKNMGVQIEGSSDWRGTLVPPYVLTSYRGPPPVPGSLSGQAAALGACLDALYLSQHAVDQHSLPWGGFGHVAERHKGLEKALVGGGVNRDIPFPTGLVALGSSIEVSVTLQHTQQEPVRPAAEGALGKEEGKEGLPEKLRQKLEQVERRRTGYRHVPFTESRGHADQTCATKWGGDETERAERAMEWLGSSGVELRAVPYGDELMLQATLDGRIDGLQGRPVAVSMDFSDPRLQHYRGGIYPPALQAAPQCGKRSATHALLLVGHGEEAGVRYWLLKNSWGRSWGEGGYIRVRKGENLCGIATAAVYAVAP